MPLASFVFYFASRIKMPRQEAASDIRPVPRQPILGYGVI
jgi:hypothetical protein